MIIKKVKINNFKRFKGEFTFSLNDGINILVGNNEAGKSTILEAIHLALTGIFNGRYVRNELTQYLFNNAVVNEFIHSLENGKSKHVDLPFVLIELYFEGEDLAFFEGTGNSEMAHESGISFKIAFDEKYKVEYEELVKTDGLKTLPIEYYDITWTSFAHDPITARSIPIKSAMIDSANNRYRNGSDVYISQIIRENLGPKETIGISQAHRKLRDNFMNDKSIIEINEVIKGNTQLSEKEVKLSVELLSKNAWENSLMTYLDDIPFHFIGKGEQSIVKTELALGHKKSKEANVILMEEPENHLSHGRLSQFIHRIKEHHDDKQIILSTHNSFVANKLGLEHLTLLNNNKTIGFIELSKDTRKFFKKIAGYDTLRLILCEKAILVEGDSDELVVQKSYMLNNGGRLPIEDGIDVISVGTSFLRFLEIAKKLNKAVAVVTDNDGDIESLEKKYKKYMIEPSVGNIKVLFDRTIEEGTLMIRKKPFNYNTLEPKMVKVNGLDKLNKVFRTKYSTEDELHKYMNRNKTECALDIFETEENLSFPDYITRAVVWAYE